MFTLEALPIWFIIMGVMMFYAHFSASFFGDDAEEELKKLDLLIEENQRLLKKTNLD